MWAGHPDGFLQVNPVVLAEPEEIGSSRFILVVLATQTGSSRLIVDYLLTPSVSNGLTHDDGTPAIEEHPLSDQCRHLAYLQRTLSDGDDDDLHDGIGAPSLRSAGAMRGGRVMVVLRLMPSLSSSC